MSRRRFLAGAGGLAATAALSGRNRSALAASAPVPTVPANTRNAAGERLYTVAGHLHASFDEYDGSWAAQFAQAHRYGVDVIMPTSHDHRVEFLGYRDGYHFGDMAEVRPDGTWRLVTQRMGTLAADSGAQITDKAWNGDPATSKGSLRMTVRSTTAAAGALDVTVDATKANLNYHGSVVGRYPTIAVWPASVGTEHGYLGLRVELSYDPRLQADRQVLYRFRTDIGKVTRRAQGPLGTVDVPVLAGQWNKVSLDLLTSISTLWPGTVAADNAITGLHLVASAAGQEKADGYLAGLLMNYDPNADMFDHYRTVIDLYRRLNPGLLVVDGLEFSLASNYHLCQVGGKLAPYPYPPFTGSRPTLHVAAEQVAHIKGHGGVATYNHPFGYGWTLVPGARRAALLQETQQQLVAAALYGAQVMETGYDVRGLDLHAHLALFDCLAANGLFVTANGATDDHWGLDWGARTDRFLTYPWLGARSVSGVQAALISGRATVGRLGDWAGGLDLMLNGRARMGQVLVGEPATAKDVLRVDGVNLPGGSSVHVVAGAVDYPGASERPTVEVASTRASSLSGGSVTLRVPGDGDRFLRAEVRSVGGDVVAFSNPVWQLRHSPPPGRPAVPRARRVTDRGFAPIMLDATSNASG
jgi:hypothetical protein